jgi:hypothetical protein
VTEWDELLEQHDRTMAWVFRPQPPLEVNLEADMERLKELAEVDPVEELRALIGLPPKQPEPEW